MGCGFTVTQASASIFFLLLITSAIEVLGGKYDDINQDYYSSAEIDPYDEYKHGDYSPTFTKGEPEIYDVLPPDNFDYSSYQFHKTTTELPAVPYVPKPKKVKYEIVPEKKKKVVVADTSSISKFTASIASSLKVLIIMLAIITPAIVVHFFLVPAKLLLGMAFLAMMNKLILGLLLWGFMKGKKGFGGLKGHRSALKSVPHSDVLQFLRKGGINELTSEEVDAIIDLATKQNNRW